MKALVLSGGGAKGAYEAGLVSTLMREFQEDFDIICGTSIGAINAAMIAQGQIDELAALWRSISKREIITPYPRVQALRETYAAFVRAHERGKMFRLYALAMALVKLLRSLPALNPLKTLARLTGAIDPGPTRRLLSEALRYERVERVLIVTATDLISQTEEVFYRFPGAYSMYQDHFAKEIPFSEQFNEMEYGEMIRASGAIPGAFSPVSLASAAAAASYIDGGVVNNTPIGLAINAGATEITVIYLDPMPSKAPALPAEMTIPEVLFNCFSIMQQRLLALDHRLALMMNDAVENKTPVGASKRMVRMRAFRPLLPLAVGVIDFGKQELIDQAFVTGQRDARNTAARSAFSTT